MSGQSWLGGFSVRSLEGLYLDRVSCPIASAASLAMGDRVTNGPGDGACRYLRFEESQVAATGKHPFEFSRASQDPMP